MSGWMVFLIITLVLGVIVSNILLLKQSAKMKVPAHILKSIADRKHQEEQEVKQKEAKKKPTEK